MWKRNILIEEITKKELEKLDIIDLRQLRTRFINIFDKYFTKYNLQKAAGMSRIEFMAKYNLLRKELDNRGIELSKHQPIDQELGKVLLKSVMWGLDISMLNDMLVIPDYVSISGDFIDSPKKAGKIKVVIKNKEKNRNEKFEGVIGQLIKDQTRKEPVFVYDPHGPNSSYIPFFDLILKAHEEIERINVVEEKSEKIDINKPYPNEHSCRLKEPGGFKDKPWGRTERVSDGKRYSIITGRLKGETTGTEQAYRYNKDIWTESQARAHCKDHDGILFESAEKVKKKEITIKKPEENDTIRIPISPECEVTATIMIDKEQGITALYCGRDKRIRTYQFDKRVKTWTMASAKAWVKEHKDKTEKTIAEKLEKTENMIEFKIMKIEKKEQVIGGIVYEPYEVDTQGDYTDEKEIEKAMYRFMEKYGTDTKRARINHEGKRYFFPILECFQPEEDTVKGDKILKKGSWWLMMKVTNKDIWEKIESGELTAFSMGGRARA